MKHAYLIIAHNNFYILEKLINLIDDERNDIYIHIDKKVKNFDFNYYKSIVKYSNLIFVDRIKVNWGGFSQIKAELILFKKSYKKKYDYYHLISGVDLPIKSQEYIHTFLSDCNLDFLTHIKNEYIPNEVYQRVSKFYLFQDSNIPLIKSIDKLLINIQNILNINRWKSYIKLQYGSNWASLTHESVKYIIENGRSIYLEIFLKLVFANSIIIFLICILKGIIFIHVNIVSILLFQIIFLVYDYVYTLFIDYYETKLRKIIK